MQLDLQVEFYFVLVDGQMDNLCHGYIVRFFNLYIYTKSKTSIRYSYFKCVNNCKIII